MPLHYCDEKAGGSDFAGIADDAAETEHVANDDILVVAHGE